MPNCLQHGIYEGWECGTCAQIAATERLRDATEEASARLSRQLAESDASAAAVQREAAWEASLEADRRAEEAREAAETLATRTLEEQRDIAANTWRSTAEAMCLRVEELLKAGLVSEAGVLCEQALRSDPGSLRLHIAKAAALFSGDDTIHFDTQMKKIAALIAGGVSGAAPQMLFAGTLPTVALQQAAAIVRPLLPQTFGALRKRIHEQDTKDLVTQLITLGWSADVVALVRDGTLPPCSVGQAINATVSPGSVPEWAQHVAHHWLDRYAQPDNVAALPWEDRILMLDYLCYLLQNGLDLDITKVEYTILASLTLEHVRSDHMQDSIHNAWPLARYRLTLMKACIVASQTPVRAPATTIPESDTPRVFRITDHLPTIALSAAGIGMVIFVFVGAAIDRWFPLAFLLPAVLAIPLCVALLRQAHTRRRGYRLQAAWAKSIEKLTTEINAVGLSAYLEVSGTTPVEDGAPQLRLREDTKRAADALLQCRRIATDKDHASRRGEMRALLQAAAKGFEASSEWAGAGSSLIWLGRTYDPAVYEVLTDANTAATLYLRAAEAFQRAGTTGWHEDARKAAAMTRQATART
jgi:hypothetical protein